MKRIYIYMYIIAMSAFGIIGFSIPVSQAQGPAGPPAASVEVAPIEAEPVEPSQTFVGTVMPRRRSVVGSAVDGRVVTFLANQGTRVRAGQPMAELLTATIKIELAAARAELELREKELQELEKTLPEDIAAARARMEQAKITAEFAAARERRWKPLFEQNRAASEEEYQEVFSAAHAAQQAVVAATADYQSAELSRGEKLAQSAARLQMQREQVNLLEDRLSKFTIKAPFDGFVVAEFTEVGAWVKQGDRIAEIVELVEVEIQVEVPEDSLVGLMEAMDAAQQAGQSAAADVRIHASTQTTTTGARQIVAGRVERIVPQANVRSRTFPVMVVVQNQRISENFLFQAGMLAHVTIPVGVARQPVPLVHKDALVLAPDSTYVYVATTNPAKKETVAQRVPVTVGLTKGERIHITGQGIEAGKQVVIRGNERLFPGQPLAVSQADRVKGK